MVFVRRMFAIALALATASSLAVGTSSALPAAAFAAGSGYTPTGTGNAAPGGAASGLAGTIILSTTIQPSGGTATATIGSATITATVKTGTFPDTIQVIITDASSSSITPPAGGRSVVTFGIGIFENGSKITGTFPAIAVTVTSTAITAGSTIYFVTGMTLQSVGGASVTTGSAAFTITSDPTVEVVAPINAVSTTPIAGATSGQTGKPFLFEGGVAIALVSLGGLMLVALLVRRRSA
jgi:hypothetical protein